MRVISYNLRKHRAAGELADLVERHSANVLCLQEAVTAELPAQIGGLKLAGSTHRNRLGLAVYYRANTFHALEARSMSLKKSLHDRVLKPAEERMLGVRLRDIDNNREFIVASFHAAPLTALNSLRRHQIKAALTELASLGESLPILMVGDYNYPVFKEHLGQRVREAGYELTLSDVRTYTRYKFFRGHYDFATSVGLDIERVTTLPQGRSDHLPILVTATPSAVARASEGAA
ncbi:endonuclease/exonuclease/phosphatase family protein [Microbacterium jiangjiandongii]|uniref:endonuclease/exonuclease/phosphatase family protein n=1 Tax=Microbacterium jiangjiandongii TaxID=3049071 RepID=UPI00214B4906|nr:endonuclease/exonuclease/phosphatase family protein [Microbacterium sp. zg.Y843]MCR2815899.1 endonuclease/exonuclease/phosphatase family protein [Microbacterium sp. zg.Y843]